jgi:hypothetical protein
MNAGGRMPLPWQKKQAANLATQGVKAGVLSMLVLKACQEPTCPHYLQPRSGPEKQCAHQTNEDHGIVSSFGEVAELAAKEVYSPSGTDSAIVAAARRYVNAIKMADEQGGDHAARAAQYLEQLKFEVLHG